MKTGFFANTDKTVVRQVADAVRARMVREKLKRGAPLPSYRELANELGVAYWTVKRGIDELVAEGVVLQQRGRGIFVAKELAPLPQSLNRLGVICPSSRTSLFINSYLTEIMHGAMLQASTTYLSIFSLREDGLVNAAQLGEAGVNGVLLLNVDNDDYLRSFAQWGTPGVAVDYCAQAVPLDYVACDNPAAARELVTHLAALGHRRVVYAAGPLRQAVARPDDKHATLLVRDSSDVRERRDASVEALRARGMLADLWDQPQLDAAITDAFCRQVRSGRGPTALLTDNHAGARGLLDALTQRGLRVPEELSVCAVAGDQAASHRHPVLTHCRFDFTDMGRKAMELLAARCLQPKAPVGGHRIGFEFVAGETTRKVGRKVPANASQLRQGGAAGPAAQL